MDQATKTCPQCVLEVPDAAQICGHCQYVWPESELGKRRARRRGDIITVAVILVAGLAIAGYWWFFNERPEREERKRSECNVEEIVTGQDLDC